MSRNPSLAKTTTGQPSQFRSGTGTALGVGVGDGCAVAVGLAGASVGVGTMVGDAEEGLTGSSVKPGFIVVVDGGWTVSMGLAPLQATAKTSSRRKTDSVATLLRRGPFIASPSLSSKSLETISTGLLFPLELHCSQMGRDPHR